MGRANWKLWLGIAAGLIFALWVSGAPALLAVFFAAD
jgi:hypothetical protein